MDRILIKGHFAAQDSGAAGSKAGNALNVDRCQYRPYNKKEEHCYKRLASFDCLTI